MKIKIGLFIIATLQLTACNQLRNGNNEPGRQPCRDKRGILFAGKLEGKQQQRLYFWVESDSTLYLSLFPQKQNDFIERLLNYRLDVSFSGNEEFDVYKKFVSDSLFVQEIMWGFTICSSGKGLQVIPKNDHFNTYMHCLNAMQKNFGFSKEIWIDLISNKTE